jgi:hypothetical protein
VSVGSWVALSERCNLETKDVLTLVGLIVSIAALVISFVKLAQEQGKANDLRKKELDAQLKAEKRIEYKLRLYQALINGRLTFDQLISEFRRHNPLSEIDQVELHKCIYEMLVEDTLVSYGDRTYASKTMVQPDEYLAQEQRRANELKEKEIGAQLKAQKRTEYKLRIYQSLIDEYLTFEELVTKFREHTPLSELEQVELRNCIYEMLVEDTLVAYEDRTYSSNTMEEDDEDDDEDDDDEEDEEEEGDEDDESRHG